MRFENVKAYVKVSVLKLNATRNATPCNNRDNLLHFSSSWKTLIFSVVYI